MNCTIPEKFRQDLSRDENNHFMGLNNEEVRKIVIWVENQGLSVEQAAEDFDVSERRIRQLTQEYRKTGKVPKLKKRGRKPHSDYPDDIKERIIQAGKKLGTGANTVAQYLRKKEGIKIRDIRVHQVLLENNMAKEDENKKGRKKPWVRYERNHSLSAVHMDWHQNKHGKWICAVLDDSSRKILSIGEYERRSAEHAIELLDEAYGKYSHIRPIREVITDRGAEFYATRRDNEDDADHSFENYCEEKGIKQLLCKYNHPQTNGKIEKWFDTYEQHRYEFDSLEDFIEWYNEIKPHMSLDWKNLETPEKAFWKRSRSYIVGNFFRMIENKERGEKK